MHSGTSERRKSIFFFGIIILAILAAAGGFYFSYYKAPDLDLPGVRYFAKPIDLQNFTLVDQNSRPFNANRLNGHWTVMFFGYTHCPDVCPTTLSVMANVHEQLSQHKDFPKTKFVFVSVDPLRDSPQRLQEYVTYFDPTFLGVTGQQVEIDKLTSQAGAFYDFEDPQTGARLAANDLKSASADYIVNHYSALIIVNPSGKMIAHIYSPHDANDVVNVLLKLVQL
jgi:protein SCO1/2